MTGIFYYLSYENNTPLQAENRAEEISHRGNFESITYESFPHYLRVYINPAQKNNGLIKFNKKEKPIFSILDGSINNSDEIMDLLQNNGLQNHEISLNELLYKGFDKFGTKFYNYLRGEYIHIIIDGNIVYCARDPIGFNPLYYIYSKEHLIVSSELKALNSIHGNPKFLEPGTCVRFTKEKAKFIRFFNVQKLNSHPKIEIEDLTLNNIKNQLYKQLDSVVKNIMMNNENVCSLLSGGVDSTVICALAQLYKPDLDVYTIAAENSLDLKYAKTLKNKYPNINHKIHKITREEVFDNITKVIYSLETFDAALIRSAIPMYILCSKVNPDSEIVLTGEGADELFGGYHYLKDMSRDEVAQELVDMLDIGHALGLQRVDRIPYCFGIEPKAPWFDLSMVNFSLNVPMKYKIHEINGKIYEKWIIHETFKDIIPDEIYLREKAKFSRGVGSQFYLRDYCEENISDDEFLDEREIYPKVFLKNKEELFYWRIFKKKFDIDSNFVANLPRTSEFVH